MAMRPARRPSGSPAARFAAYSPVSDDLPQACKGAAGTASVPPDRDPTSAKRRATNPIEQANGEIKRHADRPASSPMKIPFFASSVVLLAAAHAAAEQSTRLRIWESEVRGAKGQY
jgi:hypothetical protein